MNTKLFYKSLLLFFFCFAIGNAQEVLTLENAVKIALENNYEIKIADNNLKIEQTNVAIGNAGMLPSIGAVATGNNSIMNTSQTRADGNTVKLDNAKNNS